jgi:hypothetical protein
MYGIIVKLGFSALMMVNGPRLIRDGYDAFQHIRDDLKKRQS